jgi:hypothetical protein
VAVLNWRTVSCYSYRQPHVPRLGIPCSQSHKDSSLRRYYAMYWVNISRRFERSCCLSVRSQSGSWTAWFWRLWHFSPTKQRLLLLTSWIIIAFKNAWMMYITLCMQLLYAKHKWCAVVRGLTHSLFAYVWRIAALALRLSLHKRNPLSCSRILDIFFFAKIQHR